MKEAKELILEDAIEQAIISEKENIVLRRSMVVMSLTCLALAITTMVLLLR